jgi:hypothetical protein
MIKKLFVMALVVLFAVPMAAQAKELAGVKVPDTLSVGNTTLKLNGAGMRKKFFISVYVGGLYLEAPSKDAAAILATDMPKAVSMHFVRNVSKAQLVESFKEGFEANAKEKAAAQNANIEKLFGMLADVKDGDELMFVYVPGKGTTLSNGDKPLGTFEGKEFAEVIFSLWLGPKPPSENLKKELLGM